MTRETANNSSSIKTTIDSGFPLELEGLVDENTILIQRTLRSGQRICHDGNVVVLGDVNPGAEIVASGNIIVMGSLRGVVHAGAQGDEGVLVLAFRLRPTQLRIANHITRPPEEEESDPDYPEAAKIKNGVVTIETFNAQTKGVVD